MAYLERVAAFNWRSRRPPILPLASVSALSSDSFVCSSSDGLGDQRHNLPHACVQIEGQARPRPCHLPRVPKTVLGFVARVPLALSPPQTPLGPPSRAAPLLPD